MSDDEMNFEEEEEVVGEGGENDDVAETENLYYNAKSMMEENPKQAIEDFEKIISTEKEKGDWGFKSAKKTNSIVFQKKGFKKSG